MKIVAIDIGKSLGWAVYCDGAVSHGIAQLAKRKPRAHAGAAFSQLYVWLIEAASDANIVLYEDVARHVGTKAAHAYGGYLGIIKMFCCDRQIPIVGVPVGTAKKFVTNSGNATKDMMIAAAKARGHEPEGEDDADALGVLYTYLGATGLLVPA